MSFPRPLLWFLLILIVPLLVWGMFQFMQQKDPCTRQSRLELAAKYPELAKLLERHRKESDQLFSQQRSQDFMLNLEIGDERISMEEALARSVQQVDQIAQLRKRQSREFTELCHDRLRSSREP